MQFRHLLVLPIVLMAFASFGQDVNEDSVAHQFKNLLSRDNMDTTVSAGDNFYEYANDNWLKNNPVQNSGAIRGSFNELQGKVYKKLHTLLDSATAITNAAAGSMIQKVGDFYRTGMDSAAIEKAGLGPLKGALARIDSIKDINGLLGEIALEHTEGLGPLFVFHVYPDDKHVAKEICHFGEGGLGMPRGYYFDEDERTTKIRQAYKAYIRQMLSLIGDTTEAKKDARHILNLETTLAAASLNGVQWRNPILRYNKFDLAGISKLTPGIDWKALLTNLEVKGQDSVIIETPLFFIEIAKQLTATSLSTWKKYLQYHLVNNMAYCLSSAFDNAYFDFYHRTLHGQKEQGPRWKRVLAATDHSEGDLLGQMYVARYFNPDARKRVAELADNLQQAFAERISKMDWMSDSTKQKALLKVNSFTKMIGYPDEWKDYSALTIVNNDYVKNILAAYKWDYHYSLDKLGKPTDKTEWYITPQSVISMQYQWFNEIVFPAGMLHFPFFDEGADDAVIYGGLGSFIGHEMTHAFDDEGRQYDADGNLSNWWTSADSANFIQKANQVVAEYNRIAIDNMQINGRFTEGENLADLGGLNIAYEAFKKTRQGKSDEKIDGFTPDQRFFLSWAQVLRTNMLPEELVIRIKNDPHSPNEVRCNVPLRNMDAWYNAFNIQRSDKMFRPVKQRVGVW